jgi:hypothetical protein
MFRIQGSGLEVEVEGVRIRVKEWDPEIKTQVSGIVNQGVGVSFQH